MIGGGRREGWTGFSLTHLGQHDLLAQGRDGERCELVAVGLGEEGRREGRRGGEEECE